EDSSSVAGLGANLGLERHESVRLEHTEGRAELGQDGDQVPDEEVRVRVADRNTGLLAVPEDARAQVADDAGTNRHGLGLDHRQTPENGGHFAEGSLRVETLVVV